jgi:hypothetical protein
MAGWEKRVSRLFGLKKRRPPGEGLPLKSSKGWSVSSVVIQDRFHALRVSNSGVVRPAQVDEESLVGFFHNANLRPALPRSYWSAPAGRLK